MKIKNYKLKATIPTCSYGNLQPEIEIETEDIDKASEFALDYMKELHSRFSESELKETISEVISTVELKSFNEDLGVAFDRKKHTYDGYLSGSAFTKQFYPEFNAEAIAKNCEKSWGVPAQSIQDLWNSNSSLTSAFGKAVHKALEHYCKHSLVGDEIQKNTEKEDNPALPKHPLLKKIIEDFVKVDKFKGESLTEVFITDSKNKRCGQVDRLLILDEDKKTCRVQDYKINVEPEVESSNMKAKKPYDELPRNKLTKYTIQLSFYADILEHTGWTVEGIDVFVYEDKWTHYELERVGTFTS